MLVMFEVTCSPVLISVVVRNDWHSLFDQLEWVLVPEDVLQKLNKIYVEDNYTTSDITKVLVFRFPCRIEILTGDHLGSRRTDLSVLRSSCTYAARTDLSFLGHQ